MAVHSFQVTLGASATPLLPAGSVQRARTVVFQNNTADAMTVGGPEVTSSIGVHLAGGGSLFIPYLLGGTELSAWYVSGTTSDKLDVTYIE
jgi:hypothetical protein